MELLLREWNIPQDIITNFNGRSIFILINILSGKGHQVSTYFTVLIILLFQKKMCKVVNYNR